MPRAPLRLLVRTPHAVVVDDVFDAIRVPTPSGQVGLRPASEPGVLVLEPGLMLLRRGGRQRLLATAGGLLRGGRERAEVFTPLAIEGEDAAALEERLAKAQATPTDESAVRRELGRLESEILRELRRANGEAERPGRTP